MAKHIILLKWGHSHQNAEFCWKLKFRAKLSVVYLKSYCLIGRKFGNSELATQTSKGLCWHFFDQFLWMLLCSCDMSIGGRVTWASTWLTCCLSWCCCWTWIKHAWRMILLNWHGLGRLHLHLKKILFSSSHQLSTQGHLSLFSLLTIRNLVISFPKPLGV